jgi:hypothetical protein
MTTDEARKNDEIKITKNTAALLRHRVSLLIERHPVQRILRARMPAITLATCVGLLATSGALKQHPFCSMGCVGLNIEATTQPGSLL